MDGSRQWDALIIGGGPAGLSAALVLGRCRRRVLLVDAGRQRNRFSAHMHGFLGADGEPPAEFLQRARAQLKPYGSVTLQAGEVVAATCNHPTFEIQLADGGRHAGAALLLASGVVDHLPTLAGLEPLYGRSVHHCPYCDGWEWRDQRLAAYGRGDDKGAGLALMLLQWSADVVLVADGPAALSPSMQARLDARRVPVIETPIARLTGEGDRLRQLCFTDGSTLARDALFFNTGQHQRSTLAATLGCVFTERGGIDLGEHEVKAATPGLYVAGDATRDVQLVAVAVAEGVKAAFAINKQLLAADGLG